MKPQIERNPVSLSGIAMQGWLVGSRSASLTAFIRDNHAKWASTPEAKLQAYLAWFADRDLLAVIDCFGVIYGVCAIKLFDRLEDFLEPWVFEPTGKFCMVDLLVATSPVGISECFETLFDRWGPQETMLWDRQERTENGAPRMYTWSQYLKLTKRLTYGLVNEEVKNGK